MELGTSLGTKTNKKNTEKQDISSAFFDNLYPTLHALHSTGGIDQFNRAGFEIVNHAAVEENTFNWEVVEQRTLAGGMFPTTAA